ncbi:MAG: hypothetical protein Q9162_000017 [Coniocarpon cinnabarinum]
MATEQASLPVNGNFIPSQQPPYDLAMPHSGVHSSANSISAAAPDYAAASAPQQTGTDLSKDEVGWYFVEQYYTTMSKSPEKLYLFYNKRSQFVSGSETERLDVCVGQKAINDRIKDLNIQDCKVRVTNVDAQGSGQNIVIQVIGEMSTKKQPQRKFTQTFVLAEQTNGYFVLNDIFRYIVDDDEEIEGEEVNRTANEVSTGYQEPIHSVAPDAEPHTLTNSQDPTEREHEAQLVDQGLHDSTPESQLAAAPESPPAGAVNGDGAPVPEKVQPAEDTAAAATVADGEVGADTNPTQDEAIATEEIKQPEKPPAPEPTPAASPPKQRPAPVVPKTWATMAAAANRSNAPLAAPSQSPAPPAQAPNKTTPQVAQPPPAAPAAPSVAPSVAQDSEQPATPVSSGSEWQTAARDHGKKQPRPQSGAPTVPPDNSRAYMKNIGENITTDMIRTELSQYGELTYCDINRQKQCAFADFATPAAYQAAVGANPHEIGGERVIVEERRIRPQSFGGFGQRGGGIGPRGRGNFPKDGGRGNFAGRGRGGAPRGRGVSQAA